jgi:signal transduction histidine kinase
MSLRTGNPKLRSAAWRISLWATLAFAFGTMLVFVFLQRFVENDIKRRSDAWLSGEVEVLGNVAERTPKNALYGRVVREVAELAGREVPNKLPSDSESNNSVFFLQRGHDDSLQLWVGAGSGEDTLRAILTSRMLPDQPTDVRVKGFAVPFRVACIRIDDGSQIYLGLSERDELRVLNSLRIRFLLLWLLIVFFGFAIVFSTTKRMLSHVRKITEAASRIGHSDLNTRVPTTQRNDEVAQLGLTLNRMLDRIENSMHQLHTITDSLAHDLRSPLTAMRGKLEMSLSATSHGDQAEPIVSAIEELDRLTEFLNQSLDVAESKADALRLTRTPINLNELIRVMIELYEPSMAEKGLQIHFHTPNSATIEADAALVHRMVANLFDNELKHLPAGCTVAIRIQTEDDSVSLIFEDNGPGFSPEVLPLLFDGRVKGRGSDGHGLGLAFIDAVARAHDGTVTAANPETGGAQVTVTLPLVSSENIVSFNAVHAAN